MATLILDRDISTQGTDDLGDVKVAFVFTHVTSVGPRVAPLETTDSDHFLRFGWWALGFGGDAGDGVARDYWRVPTWLDFIDQEWAPMPQTLGGGGDLLVWAKRIRWSLQVGCAAHIWVYAG